MRTLLSACALAIGLGGAALAPAHAAPFAAAPMIGGMAADVSGATSPIEDVRYVNRCRPTTVHRRDRMGRPMRVTREVCSRVWVGPPRRGY